MGEALGWFDRPCFLPPKAGYSHYHSPRKDKSTILGCPGNAKKGA